MAEKFEWKRNESGEVIQRAAICQRSRRPALNYEPAPSVSATTVRPLPAGALHATGAAGWSKGLPEAASAGTQWGGGLFPKSPALGPAPAPAGAPGGGLRHPRSAGPCGAGRSPRGNVWSPGFSRVAFHKSRSLASFPPPLGAGKWS